MNSVVLWVRLLRLAELLMLEICRHEYEEINLDGLWLQTCVRVNLIWRWRNANAIVIASSDTLTRSPWVARPLSLVTRIRRNKVGKTQCFRGSAHDFQQKFKLYVCENDNNYCDYSFSRFQFLLWVQLQVIMFQVIAGYILFSKYGCIFVELLGNILVNFHDMMK